ncbi:hypothetical protein PGIGA_G00126140 [Pangasianodon gigas]|uniref:Uncharacterized protein n=1 Tax=Pangasianodon gigas TaxID=30993 RepID=A0ACC5XHZ8_PANGG|nr:hypothetical protein [Pangasianodon gigas]
MAIAGEEANLSSHIKCFAHTINLATQKGLKCAGSTRLLGKVRRIVSFFHRSTTGTAVLKEKQRLLGIPEHKLKQDVITRWNSSFDMLERFLEQQAAVCASLMDKKLRKLANYLHTLNENDITVAEDMVKLLAPVKTATTIMCEEEQPTVSVIAPLQAKLLEHFTVTAEDSSVIIEMKQAMAKDLEHRYVDNDTVSQVENATAHSSADKTSDDDPEFMPVSQAETTEEEYAPSSKKSKPLEDLFGDTFCTVDPSQAVKTPKELAHAEVVKYRDTASLNSGGKVLEW